jgi:hypothetical protein
VRKDRIAFTQSLEYRYVRTPVNSLPPFSRDTKLESVDSYTHTGKNAEILGSELLKADAETQKDTNRSPTPPRSRQASSDIILVSAVRE